MADEKNVAAVEHHKKALEKKRKAQRADSEALAKKLADASCTITRKVGENDKLFGSVSTADVADALKKAGFAVEKRTVLLDAPLKTLGVHTVVIRLEPEVEATVKVWLLRKSKDSLNAALGEMRSLSKRHSIDFLLINGS